MWFSVGVECTAHSKNSSINTRIPKGTVFLRAKTVIKESTLDNSNVSV